MAISNCLPLFVFAAGVVWLAGCGNGEEQIKVYRVVKAPLLESPAPTMAMRSPPPGHPPIVKETAAGALPPAAPAPPSTVPAPPHWEPQPLAQMRQASFLVRGENGAVADISFVTLGGSSGNLLDNVNRWLGQLSQSSITEEQLAQIVQHLPNGPGHVAVVDLEGKPEQGDPSKDGRIIAAMAPTASGTSFFKMRGNATLAGTEKENFLKWVSSICK